MGCQFLRALNTANFIFSTSLKYCPFKFFNILIKVILTGHTSHHIIRLPTCFFMVVIWSALSLLRGLFCIKPCLVLVGQIYHWYFKVLCIYILRMLRVNRNDKMTGNGVVAKLLFLISVYEFPLLL